MPWVTPTLDQLRTQVANNIVAQLRSGPMIPNSGLRIMSDANAGLAFLTLLYIDWLSLQLLPDTAETQFLDRHAAIWLTQGRKTATFGSGQATITGTQGLTLPLGTQFSVVTASGTFVFQCTQATVIGAGPTNFPFVALVAGQSGLVVGSVLGMSSSQIQGIATAATISTFTDGINGETDDQLRARVLLRIQQPPMGGDASDYVAWALQQPGVTRAWCSPNEMGPGTVTVRFMMDNLRAGPLVLDPNNNVISGGGFPLAADVATVQTAMNALRPVAIKDFFVLAPLPSLINFTIVNLNVDTPATRAAITANLNTMLLKRSAPASAINGVKIAAQNIFGVWITEAIMETLGVNSFDPVYGDFIMPNNGSIGTLGTITYITH